MIITGLTGLELAPLELEVPYNIDVEGCFFNLLDPMMNLPHPINSDLIIYAVVSFCPFSGPVSSFTLLMTCDNRWSARVPVLNIRTGTGLLLALEKLFRLTNVA